jgi:hypothetical protein
MHLPTGGQGLTLINHDFFFMWLSEVLPLRREAEFACPTIFLLFSVISVHSAVQYLLEKWTRKILTNPLFYDIILW